MTNGATARTCLFIALGVLGVAGLTVLLLALLTNIFERKQEARQPFVRLVEVTEDTMDPKVWGQNWPAQYDSYLKTSLPTATKYGGRGLGASDGGPAEQKLDRDPWLRRIFAGYAFAIDYRDRRGHAYALFDQEQTRRVTEKKQPGACLQCHAANLALYRFLGKGDVTKGFEQVNPMPYDQAHNMRDGKGQALVQHPLACVDCHEPKTMRLRVTPPGLLHAPGDAGVRVRPVPRGVLLQGHRQDRDVPVGQRLEGRGDRGVLRQGRLHGLDPRRDGRQDAQGAAPGVRGVEPGHPRA